MYTNFMSNAKTYLLWVQQLSMWVVAGSVVITIRRRNGRKKRRDHWKEIVGGADLAAGE